MKKVFLISIWREELRDITRPESLIYSCLINEYCVTDCDRLITADSEWEGKPLL